MATNKNHIEYTLECLIDIQKNNLKSDYTIGIYNGLLVAQSVVTQAPCGNFANLLLKKNRVRYKK